jgi:hypothetical protein
MHQPPTQPSATGLRDAGRCLVAMFVLGVVPGCLGPAAIRGTRLHYNQAYERTADQELLLNIVRMRYADSPVFIDLPAITSQFEASSNGVGGASNVTRELGYLSGNFLMRDAPTLSYAPRSGREYAKTLITPLKAEALINTSPGGNTRNFFLGAVDSINGIRNAPLATSPHGCVLEDNQSYRFVVESIMTLQARGAIELRVATEEEFATGEVPPNSVTPQFLLDSLAKDFVVHVDASSVRIAKPHPVLAVVVSPEELDSPEMRDLCELLQLTPGLEAYRLVSQEHDPVALHPAESTNSTGPELLPAPVGGVGEATPTPGRSSRRGDTISLNMRSLYQTWLFSRRASRCRGSTSNGAWSKLAARPTGVRTTGRGSPSGCSGSASRSSGHGMRRSPCPTVTTGSTLPRTTSRAVPSWPTCSSHSSTRPPTPRRQLRY